MPKTSRFTLEERLAVLELIKPRVNLLDALICDSQASDCKKEAWESIAREFIKDRPERKDLTDKEVRELWRRMKHKARMEVRHSIQSARVGNVRTVAEADSMGWLPDNTGHKVIDINDLGLEPDTKFITDFVPLLEEEATVLETRNGVLQDFKEKNLPVKRRASNPTHTNDMVKVIRSDLGVTQSSVDDLADLHIVEVLEMSTTGSAETELTDRLHSIPETPRLLSKDDDPCGIQITSVVSQQPQFSTDISKSLPIHYDQRMNTTMNSAMNPKTSSNMTSRVNSTVYPNITSTMSPSVNSKMNSNMSTTMGPTIKANMNFNRNPNNSTRSPNMKMSAKTNSTMAASQMNTSMNASKVTTKDTMSKDTTNKDLTELSVQFLRQEHEAKMELIQLKQAAAKAKTETARAKRSAYDEKRMFYFEKRKQLHDIGVGP